MDQKKPRPYYLWIKVFDKSTKDSGGLDPELDGIVMRLGSRPPRAANVEQTCWWIFDDQYDGIESSTLTLGYSPKRGTRSEAIAWLESGDGKDWLLGAETFELLSFTAS